MQQRREGKDSLDDFPTPPWATRALCEFLAHNCSQPLDMFSVREPAANRGHMAKPLAEYFGSVIASDVHDYGVGYPVQDYLFDMGGDLDRTDWTITNPPFRLAPDFIDRALRLSDQGAAMFVRSAFLEGGERFDTIFAERAPSYVLQFTERVVIHKGTLSANGSTATAYCWLIWLGSHDTRLRWTGRCRKRLERAGDYT